MNVFMIKSPPKIAIVGFGSIGKKHLQTIKSINPEALVIVKTKQTIERDIWPEKTIFTNDIKQIIDMKPSSTIIATPASEHSCNVTPLLAASETLIIEKPIAANTEQAELITKAVTDIQKQIWVAYNLRYTRGLYFVKRLIKDKQIGHCLRLKMTVGQDLPSWRPSRDFRTTASATAAMGGGVVRELSHELDIACSLFGPPSNSDLKRTKSKYKSLDVEDTATITCSFLNNSISARIDMDFTSETPHRKTIVTCSKGQITWDLLSGTVQTDIVGKHTLALCDKNDISLSYERMWRDILAKRNLKLPRANEALKLITWIEKMESHSDDGVGRKNV